MIPYEKSLASFLGETKNGKLKIDCWHPTKNGNINIREILSGGTSNKYWFKCDYCPHDFKKSPYHLTRREQWCPYCSNKNTLDLSDFLSLSNHEEAVAGDPAIFADVDLCCY